MIKKAKELGIYVIAADGNPNAVGLKYADKALVVKHHLGGGGLESIA